MACYRIGHRDKNVAELKEAESALEQALNLDPNHKQAREQLENLRKLLECDRGTIRVRLDFLTFSRRNLHSPLPSLSTLCRTTQQ
jgi:hypothetical protein